MHYLIQVNLYLIVFFAFYVLFLRKETFYQANRFYLMWSGIISFVIPFLQTEWVRSWFVTQEVSLIMASYDTTIMDVSVIPVSVGAGITLTNILLTLYIIGLFFFTSVFGLKVLRTIRAINQFDQDSDHAYSFLGRIRIGRELTQYKAVLDHEKVHVMQCHSFDVILFEVVAILCWMNPLVYILKREIKLLHEYQADEYASGQSASKAYYAALLMSQKFGISPDTLMANSFFTHSFLKSRIRMLTRESSGKRALLKYGFIAPLFLGMMVLASASIAKSDNLRKIEKYTEEAVLENPVKKIAKDLKEVRIDLSDFSKGGLVKTLDDGEDISFGVKEKELAKTEVKVIKEKKAAEEVDNLEVNAIFVGTEVVPEFPGGESEMYRFLGSKIIYPEAAQRAHVQGRVVVQFVIEKDGSISNTRILKGQGFGLDEEALRVVAEMPKWSPARQNGHPVRVFFTIPITYTLTE